MQREDLLGWWESRLARPRASARRGARFVEAPCGAVPRLPHPLGRVHLRALRLVTRDSLSALRVGRRSRPIHPDRALAACFARAHLRATASSAHRRPGARTSICGRGELQSRIPPRLRNPARQGAPFCGGLADLAGYERREWRDGRATSLRGAWEALRWMITLVSVAKRPASGGTRSRGLFHCRVACRSQGWCHARMPSASRFAMCLIGWPEFPAVSDDLYCGGSSPEGRGSSGVPWGRW